MNKILSFAAVVASAYLMAPVEANPLQTPTVPYVNPFQFCQTLSSGDYCNSAFPRAFINCPSSQPQYCPERTICQVGATAGTVQCVPNLWDPVVQTCQGKPNGSSFCYHNTTIECTTGEQFLCPPDLSCKRRGRRAYCVQPQYQNSEPTSGFCTGLTTNATVCHPTNLKKVISCPSETTSLCPLGELCSVKQGAQNAECLPFTADLVAFCSNKPMFSSQCLPGTKGALVLCSQKPQILNCPTGKCRQNRSITAQCV